MIIFFPGAKIKGEGVKNRNLGHLSKFRQILYTKSMGTQNTKNAKNYPAGGQKWKSRPFNQTQPNFVYIIREPPED